MIIELLYDFLGEKLFSEFEAEFYYLRYYPDMENLIKEYGRDAISDAFVWNESFKGYNYWDKINNNFNRYLDKVKK